ncbi:patched domain-containing protein 3-like [Centruroides sculpturatus]|uniref:patched domain-containing protein 3-like n=1 Tax=Centruroides sculpturatus TaxID=218467 RepID=UPI000C6E2CC1|nr:patched domain-containing protein 3-like [Centruroides sculpturatus]
MEKKQKFTRLSEILTTNIGKFAKIIGTHPFYFIFPTLLLSGLLSIGIMNIKTNYYNDYLLTPDRGRVFDVMQFIDKTFPMNYSTFYDFLRMTKPPLSPIIYLINKKGESIFNKNVLEEIKIIDKIAKNVTITVNGNIIRYHDVCGIVDGKCFENPLIPLINNTDVSNVLRHKYPLHLDPLTFVYKILCINLGGVKTDDKRYIKDAKAIRLIYPVDEFNTRTKELSTLWKEALYNRMKAYSSDFVEVLQEPFQSTESEMKIISDKMIPLINASALIIIIICVITYMTNSWVRSKPWMAVASVVSTGMATAASFGFLCACGVENVSFNFGIPYIILATEVDNAFVIVSFWRQTSPYDSVVKRMEKTYSNAAVSITTTSLMKFSTYCIGMTSPFPGVRTFFLYAAVCVFFNYLFQLCFFGGCLALSGYREEKGLHSFTCRPVLESSKIYEGYGEAPKDDSLMTFFKNKFATFISQSRTQTIITVVYLTLLSIGIWRVLVINEGFDVFKFHDNNYKITQAYRIYYNYFTEYPYTVHVVINENLDYSDPRVQNKVQKIIHNFHSLPNIAGPELDIFWLKYFKIFQDHPISKYSLMGYDMTEKKDFMDALKNVFLNFKGAQQFRNDIYFNHNNTEIISTRFLLIAKNVSDKITEVNIMKDLWRIANEAPFKVNVHMLASPLIEQAIIVKTQTFQVIWITSLLTLVIFICFIPNFICASVVAVSVISISVQTIGYISLWGINLDIISMITLILCIGFSVNYPTHMCYSFVKSEKTTTKEKLKDSLFHLGFPVCQGSLSTDFGLVIVLSYDYFINKVFVIIIAIITAQTAFHAMFVIPVMLSFISFLMKKWKRK